MELSDTKICSECAQAKTLDSFPKCLANKGEKGKGVASWCYECCAKKAKERRHKDPVRVRELKRKWNREHPLAQKAQDLKKLYGTTLEKYEELLLRQGGCCAICGSFVPSKVKNQKWFYVDHNHRTGEIRGLLCLTCNSGIGLLQDPPKYYNEL
jgi:hypothetical protein